MLTSIIVSPGTTGTDEPPGITALSLRPLRMPPASSSRSANGMPSGTSKLPGFATWPDTEKIDRAAGIRRAEAREPLRTLAQDGGHGGEALRVVDGGRRAVEAERGRERRLEARLAGLALERIQQRRFFAADVGAGADERVDVHVDAAALDVLAEQAGRVRFLRAPLRNAARARRGTHRGCSCTRQWCSWRSPPMARPSISECGL